MEETQFQSLVQDDTPGEGNSNPFHYSCLGNPMDREPGGLLSMGLQRVGYDLVTGQQHQQSTLSLQTFSQTRDLICGVQMLIQRLGFFSLQTNHAESCNVSKNVTWVCSLNLHQQHLETCCVQMRLSSYYFTWDWTGIPSTIKIWGQYYI